MSVKFRVLVVDDEPKAHDTVATVIDEEFYDDIIVELTHLDSFDEAESLLGSPASQFDLVVLDVMDNGPLGANSVRTKGTDLYSRIRKIRWVPVIFFTAIKEDLGFESEPPLRTILGKDESSELGAAIRRALESNAAGTARELVETLDRETRMFLDRNVAPHWDAYTQHEPESLRRLLVSRLAAWLRDWETSSTAQLEAISEHVPSASFYLVPPVGKSWRAGTILRDPAGDYWIVLTPSCDLVLGRNADGRGGPKAARILLARLVPVDGHGSVAKALQDGPVSNNVRGPAVQILRNRNDFRWFYLPEFLGVPDRLVDLEHLVTHEYDAVSAWERIADLDSPFAEELLARQSHWRGRIGTPELGLDDSALLDGLRARVRFQASTESASN
ncbi:hypothetical protein ARGLB_113_00610 [Arthrobacter globiformis NBRC 12137]|uniref:Response regulatory domain-containing protein n=1 Tax=Arthrobacter globiformis (strain ATCC 8010 / DSM 20124 / JCM 1332 / NBRC 12137 / NCIMB 8907 / NRRL B-2979 / 168) TaxID=1077972 RepID=H0QTQ4_ARTG1|nr:response regulator transcription factor [Arthrobacter globiformis]GAB16205.1 hypothetical protein ARGLB_113_00610 [Arthrobacter globiformis NBRC 12137]